LFPTETWYKRTIVSHSQKIFPLGLATDKTPPKVSQKTDLARLAFYLRRATSHSAGLLAKQSNEKNHSRLNLSLDALAD